MEDTITVDADVAATTAHPHRRGGVRVDVVGVSRHAATRQVLHDVSFSVAPGELVALVGGTERLGRALRRAPSAGARVLAPGPTGDGTAPRGGPTPPCWSRC